MFDKNCNFPSVPIRGSNPGAASISCWSLFHFWQALIKRQSFSLLQQRNVTSHINIKPRLRQARRHVWQVIWRHMYGCWINLSQRNPNPNTENFECLHFNSSSFETKACKDRISFFYSNPVVLHSYDYFYCCQNSCHVSELNTFYDDGGVCETLNSYCISTIVCNSWKIEARGLKFAVTARTLGRDPVPLKVSV